MNQKTDKVAILWFPKRSYWEVHGQKKNPNLRQSTRRAARAAVLAGACIFSLIADPQRPSAADAQRGYRVSGIGGDSCSSFIAAREKFSTIEARHSTDPEDVAGYGYYVSWLNGYLSQYNRMRQGTYSIEGRVDMEGFARWIMNYCQQRPLASFADAAGALIEALYPNRYQTAPK